MVCTTCVTSVTGILETYLFDNKFTIAKNTQNIQIRIVPCLYKYSEDDIIKMLEFLVDNIFVVFCRKSLPADRRHSNWYELCPSSCRHLSVFIRSGFHTIFALYGKETFSISVQSHLSLSQTYSATAPRPLRDQNSKRSQRSQRSRN